MEVDAWVSDIPNQPLLRVYINFIRAGLNYAYHENGNIGGPEFAHAIRREATLLVAVADPLLTAATWTRLKFSRVGNTFRGARTGGTISVTDTAPATPGPSGLALAAFTGSGIDIGPAEVRFRNLAAYVAHNITVAGLAGTQYVALTDPTNTVIAKALQSAGTATIDCTSVAFAPYGVLGKVRVYDKDPATTGAMQVETSSRYNWGGEAWVYVNQTGWSPPLIGI